MGKIAPTPRQPPGPRPVATGRDLRRPPSDSPSPQIAHPAPRLTGRIAPERKAPAGVVTITVLLESRALLGVVFSAPSWDRWRAVLKAAYAEPTTARERALFREVAERPLPTRRVRELWCVVGRRGGKDSIAAAIATAAALGDYRALLRPGERASVLCLACDRAQAQIVLRYIVAHFQANPVLRAMIERETDTGLELNNAVEILVVTNSFRAVRGRTIVCAICDECAYWRDEETSNPDVEVHNALLPGLATLPGSMLVGISSPYRRAGLLFERWRDCYGKPDDDVLVVRGASRVFNETLDQAIIDKALERDPEAASAEWLAEWRLDISGFIDREVIDALVVPGRFELPPLGGASHMAFVDPSGGSSDSMALAIAHRDRETGRGILDAVRERRAPFAPDGVVEEFAALLKSYAVSEVHGDRYAGEWPRERFRKHGIEYVPAEKAKSDLYRDFLPLANSGNVELLDHPRLIAQLASLERRTVRGGRDSIDHPPGSKDDVANCVAGALVRVAGGDDMDVWRALGRDGASRGPPQRYAPRQATPEEPAQIAENEVLGPPRLAAVEPPKARPAQSTFAEAAAIIKERMRGKR